MFVLYKVNSFLITVKRKSEHFYIKRMIGRNNKIFKKKKSDFFFKIAKLQGIHEIEAWNRITNCEITKCEDPLYTFYLFLSIFLGSGFDVRRDMFIAELKNSNNRHRLLTEKLNGTGVYKIPDELWDRSFPLFNVELLGPNIKLECRPHGFTEDNVPVYTRTGKVANKLPFPEDIVR
jgi:hypothetical protein